MTASPTAIPDLQVASLTTDQYPKLLFFDGICAFCNRTVNQIRDADDHHRIRFSPKQGTTFPVVARAFPEVAQVDSIVLLMRRPDGEQQVLVRSAAVREVIRGLPKFYWLSLLLRIFPLPVSNIGYRTIAKLRLSLFGKLPACRIPSPEERQLFVD